MVGAVIIRQLMLHGRSSTLGATLAIGSNITNFIGDGDITIIRFRGDNGGCLQWQSSLFGSLKSYGLAGSTISCAPAIRIDFIRCTPALRGDFIKCTPAIRNDCVS